jgi:hypothetical protein
MASLNLRTNVRSTLIKPAFSMTTLAALRVGKRVRFAEEMGEEGPQASTVKIIHPRKRAREAAAVEVLPRSLAAAKPKR